MVLEMLAHLIQKVGYNQLTSLCHYMGYSDVKHFGILEKINLI